MRIGKRRLLAILISSLALGGCTSESPPPVETESVRSTSQASSDASLWTAASAMKAERKAHAALKLQDGRVFVVGGTDDPTQAAELYNADRNEWTLLTLPDNVVIAGDTSCRPALSQLGNGVVLVVFGETVWSVDLEKGEWSAASLPITVPTCKPHVAALPGNRALILADVVSGETFIYESGVIDATTTPIPMPTTGTWIDAAVISLQDQRVLLSGGTNDNNEAVIFDPTSDTWVNAGTMFFGRSNHSITLLPSGNVLVVGGQTQGTIVDQWSHTAEIFNLKLMQWIPTTNMLSHRNTGPKAVQLPSGFILVVGGSNTSTAELFDPSTSLWSLVESTNDARYFGHESTVLDDGRALVTGGNVPEATATAALCDALAFAWEKLTPPKATNRVFHSATKLADGRMLVVGGRDTTSEAVLQDAWMYDPAITDPTQGPWSSAGTPLGKHALHAATKLADGRVLVIGGTDGALPELFDSSASSNMWTTTNSANAPAGIAGATATLLNDGRVLVVGGFSTDGSFDAVKTVYLYDPATNTWENDLSLPDAFAGAIGHSATLLADDSVVIIGGVAKCPQQNTTVTAQNVAARFIPKTKQWEAVDEMPQARAFHSATILPNGHVVLAGGGAAMSNSCMNPSWDSVYTSTLIFEPLKTGAEQWVYAGTMNEARTGHQAVLLEGGRLLVAGGLRDNFGNALSSAELFDPNNDEWSSTSRMQFARYGHTLVSLAGGVVALGGYLPFAPSANMTTSVERFPQAALGQRCTFPDQCISNICADGVCCDQACDSECLSCTKVNYETIAKLGEGYCEDVSGCSPYACVVDTGACGMSCTDVSGCASGYVCDPTGECVTPVPNASKLDEAGCAAAPTESNAQSLASFLLLAGIYALRRKNAQRKS
jgi:N-acetylneuraminic acid mutarotase